MKIKQLFLGASTVCMLAVAALMVQSAITGEANATTGLSDGQASLLNRVKELEWQQQEDDQEFLLIDATLTDMDAKFEAKLMHLRTQLNELGVPVKSFIGDEIGVPLKTFSSVRRTKGITRGPGGSGWVRSPNGKTNPAGKRENIKEITKGPGGSGW